MVSTVTFCSTF
ncbi:hypothetical protein BLA29_014108 [Euroglyphus maynei]|uniref:Uncharacterized protein n=1 Tax=Euroglyphus maynei TaxID=6958 RepID=A0A1Y3B595_EURMA|nr:hypothetical protein BLA29_014108 [Euroglyphus maynei]